jgi:parvulin-like peptidyl-prolyl isomerase
MPLKINGQIVDDSTLYAEFSNVKSYFERMGNVSCCERDEEFRGYAKENVIARILLAQHAEQTVPEPPPGDVDHAFDQLKHDHGGEAAFYAAIGATTDQTDLVRRDLGLNLRIDRLIQQLDGDAEPTDDELRRFYEDNIGTFMNPEEVRASHISKAPPRNEEREATYELFRDIRRQLLAGAADFDELARQHSDRGSDLIDLGFFKKGDLPQEFELVAFSMNVGEISPVFGSAVGYHLIKLTGHKPATPRPFEQVRDEVTQLFLTHRRQQKVRELVERLKAQATIEELPQPVEQA